MDEEKNSGTYFVRKPSLQHSSSQTQRDNSNPQSRTQPNLQHRRTISKSESESSSRFSRQQSVNKEDSKPLPFIPKVDYPIPRAELSEKRRIRRSESQMSDAMVRNAMHEEEDLRKVSLLYLITEMFPLTAGIKFSLYKCYSYILFNF